MISDIQYNENMKVLHKTIHFKNIYNVCWLLSSTEEGTVWEEN